MALVYSYVSCGLRKKMLLTLGCSKYTPLIFDEQAAHLRACRTAHLQHDCSFQCYKHFPLIARYTKFVLTYSNLSADVMSIAITVHSLV